MNSNLNKTKNPSQKKSFETSYYNPRYHSNYGDFIFRHFSDSNKPFAFTQHYGRSLLGKKTVRSFDSEAIGHMEAWLLSRTNRQLSVNVTFRPSSSQSFFVIFKFVPIISPKKTFVNTFCKIFLEKYLPKMRGNIKKRRIYFKEGFCSVKLSFENPSGVLILF